MFKRRYFEQSDYVNSLFQNLSENRDIIKDAISRNDMGIALEYLSEKKRKTNHILVQYCISYIEYKDICPENIQSLLLKFITWPSSCFERLLVFQRDSEKVKELEKYCKLKINKKALNSRFKKDALLENL